MHNLSPGHRNLLASKVISCRKSTNSASCETSHFPVEFAFRIPLVTHESNSCSTNSPDNQITNDNRVVTIGLEDSPVFLSLILCVLSLDTGFFLDVLSDTGRLVANFLSFSASFGIKTISLGSGFDFGIFEAGFD